MVPTAYLLLMSGGFVVGVFGHLIRSTPVIVLGIVMIGVTGVLILLAVNPSS